MPMENPKPENKPVESLICPHCGEPIRELEFRPFGPNGVFTLIGHKSCMKALGGFLVPPVDVPKKGPIITP